MIVLRCDECGKAEVPLQDWRTPHDLNKASGWLRAGGLIGQPLLDRCPECRERLGVEPISDFAEA